MTMNDHMATYPLWVQIWLGIMMLMLALAIPFAIKDWRARWVLLSMIPIMLSMNVLFANFGFSRILGLAHIIWWTPLWLYLWRSRRQHPARVWTGRYVLFALGVIGLSLILDYADVARFILGERGTIVYS